MKLMNCRIESWTWTFEAPDIAGPSELLTPHPCSKARDSKVQTTHRLSTSVHPRLAVLAIRTVTFFESWEPIRPNKLRLAMIRRHFRKFKFVVPLGCCVV